MLMKEPEERGRYQGAAGTVCERNESAPVLSVLLCCLSAHSLPCTPNRREDVHSNTFATVVKYTNLDDQIDNTAVSNMVEHTGDRVLIRRVTCTHT